jgi:hypothetical protein
MLIHLSIVYFNEFTEIYTKSEYQPPPPPLTSCLFLKWKTGGASALSESSFNPRRFVPHPLTQVHTAGNPFLTFVDRSHSATKFYSVWFDPVDLSADYQFTTSPGSPQGNSWSFAVSTNPWAHCGDLPGTT